MRYVGIDVHKSFSRIAAFDPATGAVQDVGNVPSHWELLCAEVQRVEGEKIVVIEAGRTSHFLAAKLEAVAAQVWIVDPAVLRTLVPRGAKTDRARCAGAGGMGGGGKVASIVASVGEELGVAGPDAREAGGDPDAGEGAHPDAGSAGAAWLRTGFAQGPVGGGGAEVAGGGAGAPESAGAAGPGDVAGDAPSAGGARAGAGAGGGAGGPRASAGAVAAEPAGSGLATGADDGGRDR